MDEENCDAWETKNAYNMFGGMEQINKVDWATVMHRFFYFGTMQLMSE